MSIQRIILNKDKSIFVVKLKLDTGDLIPEHFSSSHVTATVTSGMGVFTIEKEAKKITKGDFLSMKPYEKHSIKAVEPLEIIVHHIALNSEKNSDVSGKICGLSEL